MSTPRQTPDSPKSPRTIPWALLVAFILGGLGLLGYGWMRDDALATLIEASGPLDRDTAATQARWLPANLGDRFQSGDGARTSAQGLAHFRLINGARLRLEPSSQVRFQAPGGQHRLKLQVDMGDVDVLSGADAVHVESEFGELRLDPNSSVHLRRADGRLLVKVELGRLELGAGAQGLTTGQTLALEIGGIRLDPPPPEPSAPPADAGTARAASPPASEAEPATPEPAADLVVHAGDGFVVHDPNPPVAIAFDLKGVCDGPARLSSGGRDAEAAGRVGLSFPTGRHRYEVRCLAQPRTVAARGSFSLVADSGTRQLPSFAPSASVIADGRSYTVMYQFRLPNVTVSWSSAPPAASYALELDGRSRPLKKATYELIALGSGSHQVAFSAATTPPRRSRTTTIEVVLDRQAPAARVSAPAVAFEPAPQVRVAGQALPGWRVSIAGEPLPLDENRNFSLQQPGENAIAIAFSHPTHGTHYYLRRPKGVRP